MIRRQCSTCRHWCRYPSHDPDRRKLIGSCKRRNHITSETEFCGYHSMIMSYRPKQAKKK